MHIVMPGAARYINEAGILNNLNHYLKDYGKRPFILAGKKAYQAVEGYLNLAEYNIRQQTFIGECSYENINLYAKIAVEHQSDAVIGIGGGKSIDTAKAVAARLDIPFISIPTVASTCAAWTPLSVIYTVEGSFIEYIVYPKGPALVLVDPNVLINSPVRYFLAGIGDTFAKYYEADALCQQVQLNVAAQAGLLMAKLSLTVLREQSESALQGIKEQRINEAFNNILDTIFMAGGLVGGLGDKYGRIAAAHSIHNGLTNIAETHHLYHGEKVAYGILVQLVLEKRPEEMIKETIQLFARLNLPVTYQDLGIKQSHVETVAKATCAKGESIHLMPFPISSEDVIDAMERLEELVSFNALNL